MVTKGGKTVSADRPRLLDIEEPFSLAATCGPVAWGRGRWPSADWVDGSLNCVDWEGERVVWRRVRQRPEGGLAIEGSADPADDAEWGRRVLGLVDVCPPFADPTIERLRRRYPGLRCWAAGSTYEGLVSSIVGQSISVAAAAVTETRLAALFAEGIELAGRSFWPLPTAEQLAEAEPALIRQSGVTWRRAEALVRIGQVAVAGQLPDAAMAASDPVGTRALLRALPLVGPWTAESALLWGLGDGDAHPTGDVALLRAARRAYALPELDLRGLDRLSEQWRPVRGWAARLLWTELLGVAGNGTANA